MSIKIKNSDIIFLVRSYNEATRIETVLDKIVTAGYHNIIVVDDGSTDGTKDIIKAHIHKGVHYIRHPINRGGGAAMETGFEYIRRHMEKHNWKYVVTFDADDQHDITDMPKFISAFEKYGELDVVLGSRFIVKTKSNVPLFRRMILWGGKVFTFIISGARLTDTHNGYRMFRAEVVKQIRLTLDGMEYASELIDQMEQLQVKYMEVPVNIHYDSYTLMKGQRFGGPVRIAIKMIYKKFFY